MRPLRAPWPIATWRVSVAHGTRSLHPKGAALHVIECGNPAVVELVLKAGFDLETELPSRDAHQQIGGRATGC